MVAAKLDHIIEHLNLFFHGQTRVRCVGDNSAQGQNLAVGWVVSITSTRSSKAANTALECWERGRLEIMINPLPTRATWWSPCLR